MGLSNSIANKTIGGDGIPTELFKSLKVDAFVCTITSSPHPLLVTVKHNGKAKPAYRQIISVPGKLENKRIISRTYSFTPGLNEKGGKWEICVEDLFSDRQTSVTMP